MKTPSNVMRNGTDYAAGWDVGRELGKERSSAGHLVCRRCPEHMQGTCRETEWDRGYRDGLTARKNATRVCVVYTDTRGNLVSEMLPGSNREIVNRLALAGVAGDVMIARAKRVHRCGI